jgi:hypothetical protein
MQRENSKLETNRKILENKRIRKRYKIHSDVVNLRTDYDLLKGCLNTLYY